MRIENIIPKWRIRLFIAIVLIANIAGIVLPGKASADTWYNTNWLYRKKITLNAASGASPLTNFPVLVNITSDGNLGTHAQLSGNDILFTAADKITKLNHEIEKYSSNGATANLTAWVRIPTLSNATTTDIYVYYGNSGASSQQNATGVWDSNYKMVQHLEETSGSITDSTTYANGGTASITSPGTMDAAGKIDGADSFDGTNDQIALANSGTILPSNTNTTFSAWIYLNSISSGTFVPNRVFSVLQDASNSNLGIGVSSGGLIAGFTRNGGTATEFTGGSVSTGQWYYITLVKSGTIHQLYLNGTSSGSAVNATPSSQPSANPAYIGHDWGSGSRYFNGAIDEVAISDIARSAGWIQTSYNNQNSPSTFYAVGAEENVPTFAAVTTNTATAVQETYATLNGNITATGGDNPAERGFEWATNPVFTASSNWTETGSFSTGIFSHTLSSGTLAKGQLYYYRTIAKNVIGWANGSAQTFLTKPDAPAPFTATPVSTSQINLSWAKGAGADRTMIRYSTSGYPATTGDGTQAYFNTGTSYSVTGLSPGTTLYFSAWSEITNGTQQFSNSYATAFATSTIGAASVTTNAATAVDETTATISGTLTDNGGEDCQWTLQWGTSTGAYTANTSWSAGTITTGASFSHVFTGLSRGTKYYYRSGVQNSGGTVFGAEQEFLTKPAEPASFTATAMSDTQVDLAWTIGDGAGRTMIRVRTDSYPIDYNDGTEAYFNSGTSVSLTGLTPGTTYYYRAWSEKTGSQQWSNNYVQASVTLSGPPPASPMIVGGKVFTVNKALVLAPWLVLVFVLSFSIVILFVHIMNRYYINPGSRLFFKHIKFFTGNRAVFKDKPGKN